MATTFGASGSARGESPPDYCDGPSNDSTIFFFPRICGRRRSFLLRACAEPWRLSYVPRTNRSLSPARDSSRSFHFCRTLAFPSCGGASRSRRASMPPCHIWVCPLKISAQPCWSSGISVGMTDRRRVGACCAEEEGCRSNRYLQSSIERT